MTYKEILKALCNQHESIYKQKNRLILRACNKKITYSQYRKLLFNNKIYVYSYYPLQDITLLKPTDQTI